MVKKRSPGLENYTVLLRISPRSFGVFIPKVDIFGFWGTFHFFSTFSEKYFSQWRNIGPIGAPMGAHGGPWGPWGPMGPFGAQWGPAHVSLCNTKTSYLLSKMTPKSKMPPNGSPWLRLEHSGRGFEAPGLPEPLGHLPGQKRTKNGQKRPKLSSGPPLGPLLGAALKGRLHWLRVQAPLFLLFPPIPPTPPSPLPTNRTGGLVPV